MTERRLPPAAHIEDCPGHIRRRVRQQPHDRLSHFDGFAATAHRNLVTEPLHPVGLPPLAWISVAINPGLTALTRMPSVATSRAKPIVMVSIAPLVAA